MYEWSSQIGSSHIRTYVCTSEQLHKHNINHITCKLASVQYTKDTYLRAHGEKRNSS